MKESKLKSLYDDVNLTSQVTRFRSTINVMNHTLDTHVLRVAYMANLFAHKSSLDIDFKLLFDLAINHDFEEVFIGDIPSPVKKLFPDYDKVEKSILKNKLFKAHSIVTSTDIKDTLEYKLIKFVDTIDTPYLGLKEYNLGNKRGMKYFNKFLDKFENDSTFNFIHSTLDGDVKDFINALYAECKELYNPEEKQY